LTKLSSVKKAGSEKTRKSRKARTAKFEGAYDTLLGQLVRARKDVGLTQHQVSKMMGRSPNFMTKCESGQRSIDVMELLELALLYETPVADFFPS
jgi:ribosome-binding protein aMBF1 (putative translation factor)